MRWVITRVKAWHQYPHCICITLFTSRALSRHQCPHCICITNGALFTIRRPASWALSTYLCNVWNHTTELLFVCMGTFTYSWKKVYTYSLQVFIRYWSKGWWGKICINEKEERQTPACVYCNVHLNFKGGKPPCPPLLTNEPPDSTSRWRICPLTNRVKEWRPESQSCAGPTHLWIRAKTSILALSPVFSHVCSKFGSFILFNMHAGSGFE